MPSVFYSIVGAGPNPQGACLASHADTLWLNVAADGVIALALFVIAAALYAIARARRTHGHRDIIFLFIAFISFCALVHTVSAVSHWTPIYLALGWVKAIAASVCLVTAVILISMLPQLMQDPAPAKENEDLKNELASVHSRIEQMNSLYQASLGREDRITELKHEVNQELVRQGLPTRYQIITGRP